MRTTPYVIGHCAGHEKRASPGADAAAIPVHPCRRKPRDQDRTDLSDQYDRKYPDEIGRGTKLVLNMISTAVMIKLGRVKGNRW